MKAGAVAPFRRVMSLRYLSARLGEQSTGNYFSSGWIPRAYILLLAPALQSKPESSEPLAFSRAIWAQLELPSWSKLPAIKILPSA